MVSPATYLGKLLSLAVLGAVMSLSLGCSVQPEHQPAGCAVVPAPADWAYPTGPWNAEVGDVLADFVLGDCTGASLRFGDVLAGAELVLLNFGAGWCAPCIEEAPELEAIYQEACGHGLRVVQVLLQDAALQPAGMLFCEQWTAQHGLSFPVLVDPFLETEAVVAIEQLPVNLLVGRDGRILLKEQGYLPEDLLEQVYLQLGR